MQLLPSKIRFTVCYRSFLSKPNPPALSGSCKFIEGFSRYFSAPFMASFVNKEAFLSAGFQVRFMKHPLPSSHRSQVLFISLNKAKTCLKRCWQATVSPGFIQIIATIFQGLFEQFSRTTYQECNFADWLAEKCTFPMHLNST